MLALTFSVEVSIFPVTCIPNFNKKVRVNMLLALHLANEKYEQTRPIFSKRVGPNEHS